MVLRKGIIDSDPRGLIFEAYRIEDIRIDQCRSIFLDWVLGLHQDFDTMVEIQNLIDTYSEKNLGHPMNEVLIEAFQKPIRRERRKRRQKF